MSITYEFFWQIFNIFLIILISIVIYGVVKKHKQKKLLINSRISTLEEKVKNLENK